MPFNPNFPLYIPTKGRADSRMTCRALDIMRVPYFIIVEEQEREAYAEVIDEAKILILNPSYQRDYETCDELGDSKSKGPGPARNFAWDHSIASGHGWHWVMDDNIKYFARMHRNKRIRVKDGTIFRAMEDFCLRYRNIAMAGPCYQMFAFRGEMEKLKPFITNTRIYSCSLIRNDVSHRWRGRYNEDTILSLDMLKAGWCTVQFYAFLQNKCATQTVAGGNTDEFYAKDGTLDKSKMQVNVHPDVSKLVWRFGRWHHDVNYRAFSKNRLLKIRDLKIPNKSDNYGMKIKRVKA